MAASSRASAAAANGAADRVESTISSRRAAVADAASATIGDPAYSAAITAIGARDRGRRDHGNE
jgi:hypothetical protein